MIFCPQKKAALLYVPTRSAKEAPTYKYFKWSFLYKVTFSSQCPRHCCARNELLLMRGHLSNRRAHQAHTPRPALCVMATPFPACLSLTISASVFSLPFIVHISSSLPPLRLFYYLFFCPSFSLSFCPLQANPQTSIRNKQGSLTFNFLLAMHFSIVFAFPPF